ncbi:O-antigen ligase family protein [Jejudonia soesokkakensis]|uniref:O-antigen ligase family protein n=1 Tax=Jejudonia soesokkakensis TaxID=1323432 RepID=A0ABW2MQ87_9FLAO
MSPLKKITYVQLVALHIAIGFIAYLARPSAKLFLTAGILYFLYKMVTNKNRGDEILLAAGYITGFEVFNRMTGGFTFSYEFAKYAVIGFLTLGMFYRGFNKKSWAYVVFLLLLVPGILFSVINLNYDSPVLNLIGFNLSGPVCLGICALYCYERKMPFQRLQNILLAVMLPVVAMATYLYFYTPNIRDILEGTQSNFEASGGFGPNQVATALGLGMFILVSRLFLVRSKFVNIIDLGLLVLIGYRGIVTFSRGGIFTAAICVGIFLLFLFIQSNAKGKARILPRVGIVAAAIAIIWFISSIATLGLIDKRYSNQDAAGRVKQDVTTGRVDIVLTELDAFFKYPLTGIGIGKAKEYRIEQTGVLVASHNEISRLLSEHGLAGLLALIILIVTPLFYWLRNRSNVFLFAFLAFWFLTINHSSMRIAAPAFIYGLCLISIVHAKKKTTIHRK